MLFVINNILLFNFLNFNFIDLLFNIVCVIIDSSQYNHVNLNVFFILFLKILKRNLCSQVFDLNDLIIKFSTILIFSLFSRKRVRTKIMNKRVRIKKINNKLDLSDVKTSSKYEKKHK